MWAVINKLSSFLGFSKDDDLLKDEEDKIIFDLNSKESLGHLSTDYSKSFKNLNGIITSTNHFMAAIDGKYFFHMKDAITQDLSVGDHVEFMLDENDIIKNVQRTIVEDADLTTTNDVSNHELEKDSIITTSGVIKKRIARTVVFSDEESLFSEITFSLDHVCAEFIPSEGDLVTVVGIMNDNVLSVTKISPKITTIKSGTVTKWDIFHGVISDFATFTLESCEPGFLPCQGDKVLASLIRINDKTGYMWRAIQVVNIFQIEHASNNDCELREDLSSNKNGIIIPVLQKFRLRMKESLEFHIEVENTNSYEVNILSVFPNTNFQISQISLMKPIDPCQVIYPFSKLVFTFKLQAKYIGYSAVEYTWQFNGFNITRMFQLEVTSTEAEEMEWYEPEIENPNHPLKITGIGILKQTYGDKMPGQKKYSRSSFFPVQLGQYSLPEKILLAALPEDNMNFTDLMIQVERVIPSLREELSPATYIQYLSGLLFLEEVEILKQIGELSLERAHFRKVQEFLVLDLPPCSVHLNKLMCGDKILASLPWNDDTNNDMKFEGVIHRISQTGIWIQFSAEFHNSYKQGTEYSLYFTVSRTVLRRMHQAVHYARKFLGDQFLFPTGVHTTSPRLTFHSLPNEAYLKKNESNSKVNWNRQGSGYGRKCTVENCIDANISPKNISEINWINTILNKEQKEAVTNILKGEARPLPYIIFGPPGTGKSLTLVETILQLHNIFPNSRILVATPSNSAADLLAERILEMGHVEQKKMLRLVGLSAYEQGKIAASLMPYTAMIDVQHQDEEKFGIQVITREAIKQFSIIIGTIGCVSQLFNLGFPRGFFTHIIVDEAGQATEPEVLSVLILLDLKSGQVILAGDPLQLGPVTYSKLAQKYGLQESFLSRLLDRFPYKHDAVGFPRSYGYDPRLVTKLVNNYRSLPAILELPNMLFYNNDLIPNVSEESSNESNLIRNLKLPFGMKETFDGNTPPLVFHGVQGTSSQEKRSHSWYNPQEAYQVFVYLTSLYNAGISPDEIGIITPYQLQVSKIRQMLEKFNIEPPKIGSVEEFQGQEKMIIIMSVVRSNLESISYDTQRALGFVRNSRRLNVAISRARALLIIIGNPHLLFFDQHWKKILRYCVLHKYYLGCDLPSGLI